MGLFFILFVTFTSTLVVVVCVASRVKILFHFRVVGFRPLEGIDRD